MLFVPDAQKIVVRHEAIAGADAQAVRAWVIRHQKYNPPANIFIEAYRPRSHFATDKRMVEAVAEIKKGLSKAKVLDNTGVKTVVKRALMEACGVWKFSTPTHHDDLRSAARIALLGMLKDEEMNHLLFVVATCHNAGSPWHVELR